MSAPDDTPLPASVDVTRSDWLVAIAAFAVSASTAALAERTGEAAFTLVAALVLAAQAAPLVVRRRHPVVSAATVGVFSMIYGLVDWADPLIPITAVVSLAAVFEYCERRTALIVLGVAGVGAVAATGLAGDSDALDWGVVVLTLVLSPVIGELMRGRRRHILELEARNERLETERQRVVEEARIAERQRIARELHDVVTHNVTMLVVRAEAAASTTPMSDVDRVAALRRARRRRPERALGELRQLLGVLRDPAERHPPRRPPASRSSTRSSTGARVAGLTVDYAAPESLPPLPGAVDLAAYRVVQEGLTNVVRHARARHAWVTIELGDEGLEVAVEDDGVGVPGATADGVGPHRAEGADQVARWLARRRRPSAGGFRLLARIPTGAVS